MFLKRKRAIKFTDKELLAVWDAISMEVENVHDDPTWLDSDEIYSEQDMLDALMKCSDEAKRREIGIHDR